MMAGPVALDPLRAYSAAKQAVAEVLLAAQPLVNQYGTRQGRDDYDGLVRQLAEDQFNMAVVGQFKRGKSSLMNAIIGRDLLPTGVLPLTSAITTLCYGPKARALLQFKGWRIESEIGLSELPDYVTERANPGNKKGLVMARIEVPVPFLRRGLYFIDTPGIGSTQSANTQTTYDFLPKADALVWVTSVEGPLAETEAAFLRTIRAEVNKLFVVVNKLDLLGPAEQHEVLDYLAQEIGRLLAGSVKLYPVSARQALAAKMTGDTTALAASGLEALERDLAAFLVSERPQVLLLSVVDRALRLLPPTTVVDRGDEHGEIHARRQALMALQSALTAGELPDREVAATGTADLRGNGRLEPVTPPSEPAQPWLPDNVCPVCDATLRAVFDYFVEWQSALAHSPEARRQLAAAHGFCDTHTWQFGQMGAPPDLSLGLAPLLEANAAGLRQVIDQPPPEAAQAAFALLSDHARCGACQVQRQAEDRQLDALLEHLAAEENRAAYSEVRGLCLPHLAAALRPTCAPDVARFLLEQQVQRLEMAAEDMRKYALWRAALRRGRSNVEEERAWLRGLAYLVGERNARALAATALPRAGRSRDL